VVFVFVVQKVLDSNLDSCGPAVLTDVFGGVHHHHESNARIVSFDPRYLQFIKH